MPFFSAEKKVLHIMHNMEKLNLKELKSKRFHFIGIGGISMSALAFFLKRNGFYVQGSDEVENDEVKKLIKKGIKVYIGQNAENLKDADIIVYSSAIHEDNVELKFAMQSGLVIIKRAELLGAVAGLYQTVIAVAGSHGKTTTTAMISEIFLKANQKPTIHLGGLLNSINSNYKIGNKKYFITENCEYMDNFLYVFPDISVILNIEKDHLDYFKTFDNLRNSFYLYAKNTKDGGLNIVCDQDENLKIIAKSKNGVNFGFEKNSDIFAKNIKEYKPGYFSFDVAFEGCNLGNIKLNIVGKHNILNATASIFVALVCGIDFCDAQKAIEEFSGVKRRCENFGEYNGATIFHDYAHHPTQIKCMIEVAKELTKKTKGEIITIFEPHTFSRTKFLLNEFAQSFEGSDYLILAPVYSAREHEQDGKNSYDLATVSKQYVKNVLCLNSYETIEKEVKNLAKRGDVIMILGAGTIEKLAKRFLQ